MYFLDRLIDTARSMLCDLWNVVYRGGPRPKEDNVEVLRGNYRALFQHGEAALENRDYESAHTLFLDSLRHNVGEHADDGLALKTYELWGHACLKIPRLRGNARTNFLRLIGSGRPTFIARGYVGMALLCESAGELETAAYYADEAENIIKKYFVNDFELSQKVDDLTERLNQN